MLLADAHLPISRKWINSCFLSLYIATLKASFVSSQRIILFPSFPFPFFFFQKLFIINYQKKCLESLSAELMTRSAPPRSRRTSLSSSPPCSSSSPALAQPLLTVNTKSPLLIYIRFLFAAAFYILLLLYI